jgi:retron-type reverse transcriptase
MTRIQFIHKYDTIISIENLLAAWKEFLNGKRSRPDVQEFGSCLMPNIIALHNELEAKTYKHSPYKAFKISDPKPRDIHKASVRDRLLHHALHRMLSPFFIKTFISDSNSCQIGKGTLRAIKCFKQFVRVVSQNNTHTTWVLKCDIRKFFANIDQTILLTIISKYIPDQDIIWLLSVIIGSFNSSTKGVGLPLGNLTSQLLVNIYMNEFDQFVKHKIKAKYYIRYADDFVVISRDQAYLNSILPLMHEFLGSTLKLSMHPNKISISTVASGVDFLGWVHFHHHKVLRTSTKKRMFRKVKLKNNDTKTIQSYLGMLKHGHTFKIRNRILYNIRNEK